MQEVVFLTSKIFNWDYPLSHGYPCGAPRWCDRTSYWHSELGKVANIIDEKQDHRHSSLLAGGKSPLSDKKRVNINASSSAGV